MKKHKTGFLVLMLALVASALTLQSCNDNDIPLPAPAPPAPGNVTAITLPADVILSNDGSSAEVAVTISKDTAWTVALSEADAKWCELTPTAGRGNGKFMVTATPNDDRMPRSIQVVVTSGRTTATVAIHQKDTLGVKIDDNIVISNEGGTSVIAVAANTLWEIRKANSSQSTWVKFTPNHGAGQGEVTFTVAPNPLLAQRSTEIIFTAGNATRVITVVQQNIPEATYRTDSLALVALYNATDGKGWSKPWDLKKPISNWLGVTLEQIEGEQRVTKLLLTARQLDGTIPLELGNLVGLTKLDLSNNSIKGDLPQEISNLTQLEELNLTNNKFIGTVSLSITKLKGLKILSLDHNRFNTFPMEICQLEKLESIHLDYNELTTLPGEITQMSNLQYLYLDNNQLTTLPSGLSNMPSLIYLHAANNQITGALPEEIGAMKKLQSLRLENNKFSAVIPASFSNLASLKYLYLANNQLTGSLPDMSRLTSLQTLDMQNNQLTGDIPAFGKNGLLTQLTKIQLSANQFTGTLTEDIRNLTNLAWLIIEDNRLSGDLPQEAFGATTGSGWSENVQHLKKLKFLNLVGNYITGSVPAGLSLRFRYDPRLNGFSLNNNKLSGPIPESFKKVPLLQYDLPHILFVQRDGVVLDYGAPRPAVLSHVQAH